MSSFTKPLRLEFKKDSTFDLLEEFEYYTSKIKTLDGSDTIIKIPIGFNTDFSSIPQLFQSILPILDKHVKAAVVHDYLYTHGYNKFLSDKIFYEAMTVLGVPLWKRSTMFVAVRTFNFSKDLMVKTFKKVFRRK